LSQRTFYSVLKEKGYNVGSVGKSDLHKPILYWGENGWIDQLSTLGFTHAIDSEGKYDLLLSSSFFYEPIGPYANYLYKKGLLKDHCKDYIMRYLNVNDTNATSLPEEAYDDSWVTQNALKILDKFKENNNPWFLMVNFTGPHDPWDITQRMKNRWKDIDFPFPNNSNMDREEINKVRQNYAAMLENIDSNIGLILNKVEEMGDISNTLVVYASDHGEMLGDNSRYFKSIPQRGSINIPLVISGLDTQKGVYSDALVELQDLTNTFVDYADGEMPEAKESISLRGIANGKKTIHRNYQISKLLNNSKSNKDDACDYADYSKYRKRSVDSELIDKYKKYFNMPTSEFNMKKRDQGQDYGDWEVIITRKYKLLIPKNSKYLLYDLDNDLWENKNIAEENMDVIKDLLSLKCLKSTSV